MHVDKTPIRGTYQTSGDEQKSVILLPLLPTDGAYSVTGQIIAVDDTDRRSSLTYYAYFSGTIVAGAVKENDVDAPEMEPEQCALANDLGSGAVKTSVTGRQMHVVLAGPKGKTLNWAWALDAVVLNLPSAPRSAQAATPAKAA